MIITHFTRCVSRISASTILAFMALPACGQQPQRVNTTTNALANGVAEVGSDVVKLTAGMNVIRAEVASAPATRAKGLMYRQRMGVNEGMIFVFEQPAEVCMWMKNTPLPLSVAFIDDQGKIVNIEDMQPLTLESHCAKKQVRYALEMNRGWFQQKNIKPGVSIEGLSQVTK